MELQGRRLFGWCAVDVLMFPVVFKEPASTGTSRCPTTGDPISLTVTPYGAREVSPTTAAVTLAPATGADIREVFSATGSTSPARRSSPSRPQPRTPTWPSAASARPGPSASAWHFSSDGSATAA